MSKLFRASWSTRDRSVEEFVSEELDGADHDHGVVEEALATARNGNQAFARLMQHLYDMEVFSPETIYEITKGHKPDISDYDEDEE